MKVRVQMHVAVTIDTDDEDYEDYDSPEDCADEVVACIEAELSSDYEVNLIEFEENYKEPGKGA